MVFQLMTWWSTWSWRKRISSRILDLPSQCRSRGHLILSLAFSTSYKTEGNSKLMAPFYPRQTRCLSIPISTADARGISSKSLWLLASQERIFVSTVVGCILSALLISATSLKSRSTTFKSGIVKTSSIVVTNSNSAITPKVLNSVSTFRCLRDITQDLFHTSKRSVAQAKTQTRNHLSFQLTRRRKKKKKWRYLSGCQSLKLRKHSSIHQVRTTCRSTTCSVHSSRAWCWCQQTSNNSRGQTSRIPLHKS